MFENSRNNSRGKRGVNNYEGRKSLEAGFEQGC